MECIKLVILCVYLFELYILSQGALRVMKA